MDVEDTDLTDCSNASSTNLCILPERKLSRKKTLTSKKKNQEKILPKRNNKENEDDVDSDETRLDEDEFRLMTESPSLLTTLCFQTKNIEDQGMESRDEENKGAPAPSADSGLSSHNFTSRLLELNESCTQTSLNSEEGNMVLPKATEEQKRDSYTQTNYSIAETADLLTCLRILKEHQEKEKNFVPASNPIPPESSEMIDLTGDSCINPKVPLNETEEECVSKILKFIKVEITENPEYSAEFWVGSVIENCVNTVKRVVTRKDTFVNSYIECVVALVNQLETTSKDYTITTKEALFNIIMQLADDPVVCFEIAEVCFSRLKDFFTQVCTKSAASMGVLENILYTVWILEKALQCLESNVLRVNQKKSKINEKLLDLWRKNWINLEESENIEIPHNPTLRAVKGWAVIIEDFCGYCMRKDKAPLTAIFESCLINCRNAVKNILSNIPKNRHP